MADLHGKVAGEGALHGHVFAPDVIRGQDGKSIWIVFSEFPNMQGFTETHREGQRYMGVASALERPTLATEYTWLEVINAPSGSYPKIEERGSYFEISPNTEADLYAEGDQVTVCLDMNRLEEATCSNEWVFFLTAGESAVDVLLWTVTNDGLDYDEPQIEWQMGIAPVFSANTTVEVRVHYRGDTLTGVWL